MAGSRAAWQKHVWNGDPHYAYTVIRHDLWYTLVKTYISIYKPYMYMYVYIIIHISICIPLYIYTSRLDS